MLNLVNDREHMARKRALRMEDSFLLLAVAHRCSLHPSDLMRYHPMDLLNIVSLSLSSSLSLCNTLRDPIRPKFGTQAQTHFTLTTQQFSLFNLWFSLLLAQIPSSRRNCSSSSVVVVSSREKSYSSRNRKILQGKEG
jgi:hypothetical protein